MEPRHETVLLEEAVAALDIQADDAVVDATLGGAGHFAAILRQVGPSGTVLGIDADADAIARAEAALGAVPQAARPRVVLVNDDFRNLAAILAREGVRPTKALFDLGWSAFHLTRGRGFSFRSDEPLHMTYSAPEGRTTARDLVNDLSEESLANLLRTLGEERYSRGIARSIVAAREAAPIETTDALVAAVEAGVPGSYRRGRIHPATKTFQALRIAANDELGALREGVAAALAAIAPGGRIAVISFHSIEDRIVKTLFRDAEEAGAGAPVTKKPLAPSADEVARNPRARSAKLRTFAVGAPPRARARRTFTYTYA